MNTVEHPVPGRLTGSSTVAHIQALKMIDEPCAGTAIMGILVNSKLSHRKETNAEDDMFLIEKVSSPHPFKISITDVLQLQLKL